MKVLPGDKFKIIFDMTNKPDNLLKVKELCSVAGVSRSGYYQWLKAEPLRREREERDCIDFGQILLAYRYRGYDKGARGIQMRLLRHDPPMLMNLKKVRRLMQKFKLKCPIRKPNAHQRAMKIFKASNFAMNILNREFRNHGVRTILLTDITYLRRRDGKYSYLSAVMDAYTKEILAHVISSSPKVDFVLETVEQLMIEHGPELNTDTLLHSDQGCQYTSHKFIELLNNYDLRRSMSNRASCWDNAPQESFFGHMKAEIDISKCYTHDDLTDVIDDWIDYYNNERYQWDLGKLAPSEYYRYITTGENPLPMDLCFNPEIPTLTL